jgi:hypothetical protein
MVFPRRSITTATGTAGPALIAAVPRIHQQIRALAGMPPVQTIKQVLGQQDWFGVLRAAGVVGETWRPSRGALCVGTDGHRCRSLLEKAIDDWFAAKAIPHECEP